MHFSTILKFSLAAALAVGFTGCGDDDNDDNKITHKAITTSIIHVNDHHSHLDEETLSLYYNGVKYKTTVGGFPRVASMIKSLQSTKTNPLTLHAGDALQGTLFYSLFKYEADAALMNTVSWDAFVLGNHEFDDGDENLANFLDALTTTEHVVAANVVAPKGNVLYDKWTPYIIKEIDGEKVGIIGIDVSQKTRDSSNPSDEITFLDEIETAQKYATELENKGVNKIILLSHNGYSRDLDLASKVSGIDVIIDGDSHSLLGDFSAVGLSASGDYPTQVTAKDGRPVCVAQAWQYSHVVGNLDVSFSADGNVTSCTGTPYLLIGDDFSDANASFKAEIEGIIAANDNLIHVTPDSAALGVLNQYSQQVDSKKAEVIGEASEFLGHNRIPGDKKDGISDLPLGSDIAPIVAKSFYDLSNRADACIQNAGGVRVAVSEGNISVGTAYTLLPFANTLFEIDMKGSEIKAVLEDALSNYYDNGGSTGSFPYAYGLRFGVDMTKAKGERILDLEVKDRAQGTWGAIKSDVMYVIVTNSYIAGGKDGYLTFKSVQDARGEGVDTYLDYALSFVRYVESKTAAGEKVSKLPSEDHCIKSYQAE